MKKWLKRIVFGLISIALFWAALTFWVELSGRQQLKYTPVANAKKTALILYNPDPIYNLDEQICKAITAELKAKGISSVMLTGKKIKAVEKQSFDIYFFCANTYNFAPDIGIRKAIKKLKLEPDTPVVAITLGAGTTSGSKRKFERFLKELSLDIIESQTFWLLRPNDENRTDEPNTKVAIDLAKDMVLATVKAIENK